ncbi:MAG: hypothetical protein JW820_16850 [Spirochaetales bacterium]|nr:hypothetical protein [Spirochaetales bacterium]
MKAFLIILLILVLAGGAVFYFGWIQIQLPPESYGVIFTKTSGYDPEVVRPGEFTWRWEKLIPTNLTLYRFDLRPQRVQLSFERELPSGELYASVLPEAPEFTIRGKMEVVFTIDPEELPGLVERQKLTPETLEEFYKSAAQRMAAEAQALSPESFGFDPAAEERMRSALSADLPELQIVSLNVGSLEMPDMELYELARQSYRELAEARNEARRAAEARLAVEEAQQERAADAEEARRENLRKYGALLNEYPVLLKAMAVQQLTGKEQLQIPELDLSDVLDFSVDR